MQGVGFYSTYQSKSTHCSNTGMTYSIEVGRWFLLVNWFSKIQCKLFFFSKEASHWVYSHFDPSSETTFSFYQHFFFHFQDPKNQLFKKYLYIKSFRSSIILEYCWFPWFCACVEGQLCAKPKLTRPLPTCEGLGFFCHSCSKAFLPHRQMSAAIAALNSLPCFFCGF